MGLNFPSAPSIGQVFPSPPQAGVPLWHWDGNVWAPSSYTPPIVQPPTFQSITASGTYTRPANCTRIEVFMVGAGGGGNGISNGTAGAFHAGADGGDSSFGGIVAKGGKTATSETVSPQSPLPGAGGSGGTGTATRRARGGPGVGGSMVQGSAAYAVVNGVGGSSYFGGGAVPASGITTANGTNADANSGAGGSSATGLINSRPGTGAGGGAGEFVFLSIPSPAATYAVVIGTGGAGGVGGNSTGGAGGSGFVFVAEYYGPQATVVDAGAVRFDTAQTLSAVQQALARANIGSNSGAIATGAPGSPGTTSSATGVMEGLGSAWKITPQTTGRVLLMIQGQGFCAVATAAFTTQIRYGTGAAPAVGAALTGTPYGNTTSIWSAVANASVGFSAAAILTGLTLGTPYWFDLSLAVSTGTGGLGGLNFQALEF